MNKEVYLEELRLWYIPHILFYKIMGWDIYIFGIELNIKRRFYTHWLIRSNWINRINTHFYPMGNSHSNALKMANKLVDTMKSNSNIQSMMELYEDEEVLLVFKRSLVEKIVILTSIHEYLNNRSSKNNTKFLLYLGKNYEYLIMLKELGYDLDFMSDIKKIGNERIVRLVESIQNSGKHIMVCMLYIAHLLAQLFISKNAAEKKYYRYCISVPHKAFVKYTGPRKYTLLVDEKDITYDETVFLFEYDASAQFIREQKSKNINIAKFLPGKKNVLMSLLQRSILDTKREIKILLSLLPHFWQSSYIIDSISCLLLHRIKWGVLASKMRFDNYIFTNKEDISQITVNIFLRKQKTTL